MDKSKLRGVLTLVLALGFVASVVNAQGDCDIEIDPAKTGFKLPVLVNYASSQILYPELISGKIILGISHGTNLIASCPGTNNELRYLGVQAVDLTCTAGQLIIIQSSQAVTWSDLECSRCLRGDVKNNGQICSKTGKTYHIGWTIRPSLFFPLIELCFDDVKETTEYAFHELLGKIIGVKMVDSCQRPIFRKGGMFTVNVHNVYKKTNEVALFNALLDTTRHLTGQGEHYLARGHLAPDADFFYTAEQNATYFYGNVIPQWQSFNNGNWKRLEFAVRSLAEIHDTTFHIWTGAYSTLQFRNAVSQNTVGMFLGLTEGESKIPVPALLWKVIYDPLHQEAVAIVSVNEVEGQGFPADPNVVYPPCNDVCHLLTWITWNVRDIWKGRTYCCEVNDLQLRTTIPTIPILPSVVSLLTN